MRGLLHTDGGAGRGVDGASTPSSAPPSPTVGGGLRRNLSGSDMATAVAKVAFDRKKGGLGGLRKWVRFDRNGETSVIQARVRARRPPGAARCVLLARAAGSTDAPATGFCTAGCVGDVRLPCCWRAACACQACHHHACQTQ
jgi:hypothetical protein